MAAPVRAGPGSARGTVPGDGRVLPGAEPERPGAEPPPVTHRVPVRFRGEGSGEGELSWGQAELWTAMLRQRSWLPLGAVRALPAGTTVADVAAELRFLMGRYQTARTRLRFTPDGVRQVLADTGEIALEVADTEPGEDPADAADRLRCRYRETPHDLAGEWPVRMAVVRHRGVPTHRVLVMCHLVTDAAGAARMATELAAWARHRATGGAAVPALTGSQALAHARWQQSPAGARVGEAALRHWERQLRRVPPRRFPGPRPPRSPRHWQGEFTSPALGLAVASIAARLRTGSAGILLTLYAVTLARLTGTVPVVVQAVTDNRFRPGLAGTVSPVSQTGLCVFDLGGEGAGAFAEAVAHVRRRSLTAYKYACYDPRRMDALIAGLGRESGTEIDVASYFNDRRRASDRPGGAPASAAQLRAAEPASRFGWRVRQEREIERLFVHIEGPPGPGGGGGAAAPPIGITIAGDTAWLSPEEMEACVRGMERLAVAAALDPATPTGLARS